MTYFNELEDQVNWMQDLEDMIRERRQYLEGIIRLHKQQKALEEALNDPS